MIWVKQKGTGPVVICTDKLWAMIEMHIAGCVDVTEKVKNEMVEDFRTNGNDDVDHFDWIDTKGETYWHIIEPK